MRLIALVLVGVLCFAGIASAADVESELESEVDASVDSSVDTETDVETELDMSAEAEAEAAQEVDVVESQMIDALLSEESFTDVKWDEFIRTRRRFPPHSHTTRHHHMSV